jgi:hypothetical protein
MSVIHHNDIANIELHADDIKKQCAVWKAEYGTPNLKEYVRAMSLIMDYVKYKRLVLYGSYAWNLLVSAKSPDKAFYDKYDFIDIDCMSSQPIHDVRNMCDLLNSHGFRYVNAKNSMHEETYSIYIASQKCCDVSYQPRNILGKLPILTINGIYIVHPKIISIDVIKMFSTPIASYWRLSKTLERTSLLFEHYPIVIDPCTTREPVILSCASRALVLKSIEIACSIHMRSSLLWIGDNYIENAAAAKDKNITIVAQDVSKTVEFVSSDYDRDLECFRKVLIYEPDMVMSAFQPFMNYCGRRVDFSIGSEVFLRMYDGKYDGYAYRNAIVVLPEQEYDIDVHVGTFYVTLYFMFVRNLHAFMMNYQEEFEKTNYMISKMLTVRESIVSEQKIDCMQDGIFQEFNVRCHGRPVCAQHQYLVRNIFRNSRCNSIMMPYRPEQKNSHDIDLDKFHFRNLSGNPIIKTDKAAPATN